MNSRILAGLISALIALRLTVVLTAIESIFYNAEIEIGAVVRSLMLGIRLPLWAYQVDAYSGESLLLEPVMLLFFRVFSPNLFAVKMVPLLFSCLTLSAVFIFTLRHFGRRAAVYASLLLVCAPPGLVQLMLTCQAGHSEAFFFALCSLGFFYDYAFPVSGQKKRFLPLALSAFIAGFSTMIFYGNAVMAVSLLILLCLSGRKELFRELPVFAGFFIIGFSPWFLINAQNSWNGLDLFRGQSDFFRFANLPDYIKSSIRLWVFDIPRSLIFSPAAGLSRSVYAWTFCLALLPAVFFLFKGWNRKSFLWLVFPAVFTSAFSALHFMTAEIGFIGYRYLTQLLIMILLAAGVSLAQHRMGAFFLGVLIVMGLAGQGAIAFREKPGLALSYHGYSFYNLGIRWQYFFSESIRTPEALNSYAGLFPEREKMLLLWGMYETAEGELSAVPADPSGAAKLEIYTPFALYPFVYEWLGTVGTKADLLKVPEVFQKYFCEGRLWRAGEFDRFLDGGTTDACRFSQVDLAGGIPLEYLEPSRAEDLFRRLETFPEDKRKWVYRGLGRYWWNNLDYRREFAGATARVSAENMQDVYWGMGWMMRQDWPGDRGRALNMLERLPAEAQPPARQGFEAFEKWYGI